TPYASRLWLASPSSTSPAYGSCVTLTFAPIIAKVRFRFTYPDETTNVAISNIKFRDSRFVDTPANADTPLRGTIDAAYPLTGIPVGTFPTLTMSKSEAADASGLLVLTTPYEEAGDQIHILKDPTLYNKWYYVPPLANIPYEQGAYTITASIGGKTVSATVPAQYMQWKAGCQYTYIFKLSDTGDSISFNDLMVEQWLPGADIKNNGSGTEDW
uniref:fimbrillin family protein n=3 Tax=Candidatus Limisoma sp. TaxID=3076476 RepID=UPI004027D862